VFFELLGIKQTAKLVNSTLMELINGVEDTIELENNDAVDKDEVINYII